MDEDCLEEKTELEELTSMVKEYKSVLSKAKRSGLKRLSQTMKLNLNKKLKVLEDKRKCKAQFCVVPNQCTIYIPDFFKRLGDIVNKEKIYLKIVPTLLVSKHYKLIYTDESGVLTSEEGEQCLKNFIRMAEHEDNSDLPLYIFKSMEKDIKVLFSNQELKDMLRDFKENEGIVQFFICANEKISSILRVLLQVNGKTKHFFLTGQPQNLINKEKKQGLLGRLIKKKLVPHEYERHSSYPMVHDSIIQESYIKSVSLIPNEIKFYSNTVLRIIQGYMLERNCKIKSIVVDFLKNKTKTWHYLSCPFIKLKSIKCTEILYRMQTSIYNCEETDQTSCLDQSSFEINLTPKKNENLKFRRSNAYFSYTNIMDQYQDDLGDKFRQVLTKVDKFKSLKKPSLDCMETSNRINDYKSYYNIDQHLNTKKKFIKNFASVDFDAMPEFLNSKYFPIRKIRTSDTDSIEPNSKSHHPSFAESYSSSVNPQIKKCFRDSISNLDVILVNIKKSRFPTINFLKKYGEKILVDLEYKLNDFNQNISHLTPHSCCHKSLLNCNYSIQYEKMLRDKHKSLNISEKNYRNWMRIIIECLKELQVGSSDMNSMSGLLEKVAKYIIN